jgi:putative hydrolase of the HAD superfamily
MSAAPVPTCLFLDIGGVLLSNGWDLPARQRAVAHFRLDPVELEERHHLASGAYEEGRIGLADYLDWTVFHRERDFTRAQFQQFMRAQSTANPAMLELMRRLKLRHGLKLVVVSNEGRELNAHRIRAFQLDRLVDTFVSSCFVHLRKPDPEIFRLALDLAQTPAEATVFIENTPLFAQIARGLGIRSILHTDPLSTRTELAQFGLTED